LISDRSPLQPFALFAVSFSLHQQRLNRKKCEGLAMAAKKTYAALKLDIHWPRRY
jgi:hypothetical protein